MRDKQLHGDREKGLDTGTAHLAAPDPLRDQSFLAVASALSLPGTCPAGKVAQPPGPDQGILSPVAAWSFRCKFGGLPTADK